jgi:two-component system sensor histidine kinase MtrB
VRGLSPELRAVYDLARAAQGAYEVDDPLDRVCKTVAETFGFDRVSVSEYFAETETLVPRVAHGAPLEELPKGVPLGAVPIAQRALESGEAVFVSDVREDASVPADIAEPLGIRSILAVPLVSSGRRLGVLGADRGGKPFELSADALSLLTALGSLAAVFFEKALERAELVRLDTLKSNFIALASHELRTPTAVLYGIAATLHARGHELAAEQLHHLRRTLYEQSDRLRVLVDQLLDLSRLEAGAIPIAPEPLRVRRRVEDIVIASRGEETGGVKLDIPPELETVADPHAFDRIVVNLVTNAFRYGEPPVVVSAQQNDRHFRLSVEDRGRGVAPEFIPHLFERFTRSEHSAELAPGGSGLGLSIAKSYANAHGGDLLYEKADPHGARFQLVLPTPVTAAG